MAWRRLNLECSASCRSPSRGYREGSGQKAGGYYKAVSRRSRESAVGVQASVVSSLGSARARKGVRRRVAAVKGCREAGRGNDVVDGGVD